MSSNSLAQQKHIRIETIQNWVAFGLIVIGIALTVSGYVWALYSIGIGIILGLFFIVKRRLPKRPSILAIVSILGCIYVPVSFWLLVTFPDIYGYELQGLVNWLNTAFGAILVTMIFVSIELFRTSKN